MTAYVAAGGPRLSTFLDGLPIASRWVKGHPVVWQTGQQDGPDETEPDHHTHCSAFVAAAAMYLDIYLLRPPSHGQIQLANAQLDWLSGADDYLGPLAADAGWSTLGLSGDADVLAAAQDLANAGKLVIAGYATPIPAFGGREPGHVVILRPTPAAGADAPQVIMAGEQNYSSISLQLAFANPDYPDAWPDNIALFVHDSPLE